MALASLAGRFFTPATPPLALSLASPASRLSDFIGISLGLRRLTGDIAWIQTLIYYGTLEEGMTGEQEHEGAGKYPLFLAYCQRVAQVDPQFKYIYYYGGAVLGWNLNRMDEAEILLKQGIANHPKEWKYQQFLAGLAYQKSHNVNDLVDFLEAFVKEKDCPNIVRSILANIYKKQKRYKDAIRIWLLVYDTQDPMYFKPAQAQIDEMAPLAHFPSGNRP